MLSYPCWCISVALFGASLSSAFKVVVNLPFSVVVGPRLLAVRTSNLPISTHPLSFLRTFGAVNTAIPKTWCFRTAVTLFRRKWQKIFLLKNDEAAASCPVRLSHKTSWSSGPTSPSFGEVPRLGERLTWQDLCDFPQFLQQMQGKRAKLDNYRFLIHSLQFVVTHYTTTQQCKLKNSQILRCLIPPNAH